MYVPTNERNLVLEINLKSHPWIQIQIIGWLGQKRRKSLEESCERSIVKTQSKDLILASQKSFPLHISPFTLLWYGISYCHCFYDNNSSSYFRTTVTPITAVDTGISCHIFYVIYQFAILIPIHDNYWSHCFSQILKDDHTCCTGNNYHFISWRSQVQHCAAGRWGREGGRSVGHGNVVTKREKAKDRKKKGKKEGLVRQMEQPPDRVS